MNRRALARKAAGAKQAAPSSASPEPAGVENVSKKLELQLAAGDFYGALQMYKTLFMRFLKGDEPSAEQQEKAAALALEAALTLIKHDQNTAATEMANLMVSVFADFRQPVDDAHKQRIRQIDAAFLPKPQFSADLALFLKNAVKWSAVEGARKRGDPELQLLLARAYRSAGDFTHAMKHFLHAENPQELAEALFQWSTQGYPSESDLYLARAVLQLLSLENLRDANKVYEAYVAQCQGAGRPVDLPLFNYTRFLLLTLERDALPLFQMLQERYAPALARDSSLQSYLSVIGQKFYGLQPPRSGLSSLLEMFSGGMQ
ncbi:Golgi to ER traffic protein 4 [Phytophthora pseudosyringae]|uniref:Golgi to ER traffic protein 4 n=1 Tax=Phytophthora pseudosyringae TaxID=221518 RepID=A0A8T1VSX3_9STRA|nr:Golgi to ER traffic protein 4 [Phytophthora pseudosyringae]